MWLILSVGRLMYDFIKIYTQERSLIFATNEMRRQNIYGDNEDIYNKIESMITSRDCILLVSHDATSYFLLRYLLYPVRIYWVNHPSKLINHPPGICNYALIYHDSLNKYTQKFITPKNDVKKIAEFSSNNHENSFLYHLK